MYQISYVPEPEESGGKVRDDIPAIPYNVEMFKPLAYIFSNVPVHDARTAKAVTENIVRYVGAVAYAELVAKQCQRRPVGISYDYDTLNSTVANGPFEIISCRLPYPQKTAVNEPLVAHITVDLRREVEIVAPIDNSVAALEEDI